MNYSSLIKILGTEQGQSELSGFVQAYNQQLQKEFSVKPLKHSKSLHAAAKVLGFDNWHQVSSINDNGAGDQPSAGGTNNASAIPSHVQADLDAGWTLTDPDDGFQRALKLSDTVFRYRCDYHGGITHDMLIDIERIDQNDAIRGVYDSLEHVHDEYGDDANMIIAACEFERRLLDRTTSSMFGSDHGDAFTQNVGASHLDGLRESYRRLENGDALDEPIVYGYTVSRTLTLVLASDTVLRIDVDKEDRVLSGVIETTSFSARSRIALEGDDLEAVEELFCSEIEDAKA